MTVCLVRKSAGIFWFRNLRYIISFSEVEWYKFVVTCQQTFSSLLALGRRLPVVSVCTISSEKWKEDHVWWISRRKRQTLRLYPSRMWRGEICLLFQPLKLDGSKRPLRSARCAATVLCTLRNPFREDWGEPNSPITSSSLPPIPMM